MGGLGRRMPVTTATFAVGALSLAGVPPFAGFASKDTVLAALEGRAGWIPWALLLATAFLTAFYMGRVLVRTFLGRLSAAAATPTSPAGGHDRAAGGARHPRAGRWAARRRGSRVGSATEFHLHLGLTPVAGERGRARRASGSPSSSTGAAGRLRWPATVAALDRASGRRPDLGLRLYRGRCSRSATCSAGWTATWWTG